MEDRRDRPSRAAVPGLERTARHAVAGALVVLGRAEPASDQPRRSRCEVCRGGAVSRATPIRTGSPSANLRGRLSSLRAEGEAIQILRHGARLDCFVASILAMTAGGGAPREHVSEGWGAFVLLRPARS